MKHKKLIVNPFPYTKPSDETIQSTKKKISWKIKAPILLVLVIACVIGINAFFNKYYLISPIKFQNPLRVRGYEYPITIKESELDKIIQTEIDKGKEELKKETSMVIKPVQAKEESIEATHTITWLIDKIWARESTRGQNGGAGTLQAYCEAKGEWNEYGYGGMAKKICFKDQAEADVTMTKWFNKHLSLKTEAQSLCFYRYGELMDNCDYYQEILAL